MIGIISALSAEIERVNASMETKKTVKAGGFDFTVGTLRGCGVATVVCGMGKVFAAACAETMIDRFSPTLVVNVGAAGTLSERFGIGDVAIAEKTVEHDMDNSPLGFRKGEIAELSKVFFECDESAVRLFSDCADRLGIPFGTAVTATGDVFVSDKDLKARIAHEFGAEIAEMEGAAVGQICAFRKTPYAVVRAVSDGADGSAPADFSAFLEKVVADAAALIGDFCERYASL